MPTPNLLSPEGKPFTASLGETLRHFVASAFLEKFNEDLLRQKEESDLGHPFCFSLEAPIVAHAIDRRDYNLVAFSNEVIRCPVDIIHLETDVMEPSAPFLQEVADGRILACRFQKLDMGFAFISCAHEAGNHLLNRIRLRAGDFTESQSSKQYCSLFDVLNHKPDVI
jgi:hypothetical protein